MSAKYLVLPVAGGALVRVLASLLAFVSHWLKESLEARRHRREANALAGLDQRMLADIGINRADLRDAFSEPFWDDPTALLRERALERRLNHAIRRAEFDLARRRHYRTASGQAVTTKKTADPSHRPLDPISANIPSRGRIRARRPLRRALTFFDESRCRAGRPSCTIAAGSAITCGRGKATNSRIRAGAYANSNLAVGRAHVGCVGWFARRMLKPGSIVAVATTRICDSQR